MRLTRAAWVLAVAACMGCGDYEMAPSRGRSAAPEAVGVAVDPFSMGEPVQSAAPAETAPQSQTPVPSPVAQASPETPPVYSSEQPVREGMVREKADVGAGTKGHYSPGIITTPLSTYWRAQERIEYEAKIQYGLKLYKGEHGHFPKTMEEFEEKILKLNQVKLPELPEGHRYVYDPEKGELLVERPRP
jgi:hypothetical protein